MKELANKVIQFIKEVYYELKKTTWLSRKEVVASTALIILVVTVLAIFIGLVDLLITTIIGFIL